MATILNRAPEPTVGTFPNGMDYATWGDGPRTLLFIQGGPGSFIPEGVMLHLSQRYFAPYVDAGYRVWVVTRRRHMPAGHTVADMADDYADLVRQELDGAVDLLVGESYGGMIAFFLAARHPEVARHVAAVVAAARVSAWGKEVDTRLAAALDEGDRRAAGAIFAEYLLPQRRLGRLRRALAPLAAPRLGTVDDVLTETRAEMGYDARPVLPDIRVPVLMVCGDRDRFFPATEVVQTARLIPDSTLVWYRGKGHMRVASSRKVARDVLAFVGQEAEVRTGR
jgi:pimeloyl-ACP methyl ester carboxylesterase